MRTHRLMTHLVTVGVGNASLGTKKLPVLRAGSGGVSMPLSREESCLLPDFFETLHWPSPADNPPTVARLQAPLAIRVLHCRRCGIAPSIQLHPSSATGMKNNEQLPVKQRTLGFFYYGKSSHVLKQH
ncbi:unnamed protein product [Victoria cruziana]